MRAEAGRLSVDVLGPLTVSTECRQVELTSPKLRALLAVLAMKAGSPVSVDRLALALWDDRRPEFLRRTVQTHLTRLRAALGAGYIRTEPSGYELRVGEDRVDALRFGRLLDAAARAADPVTERGYLTEALELWRGNPFEDVASAWLAGQRARLVERYLAAVERRADLDLAEDRHTELVAPLRELTATHPLRESLWVRFLVALDRCGRQAEALTWYETVRRRLADELGADPGPELRQVYSLLLSERPPSGPAVSGGVLVPRQLPADIDGFTGRAAALTSLDALISDSAPTAMAIGAISGPAGVGKTALAVHWAHRVADRFPDGQLYANLRGFPSSRPATAPAEVVRQFLEALGVPATRIPSNVEGQVGLYRSVLAGRRVLVVLDNVRDSDQVRPLLPGGPTCVVVVTSRSRMTGLTATEAARPLILDVLSHHEARDLLAARLGGDRIAGEPDATEAIIARSGRLPLALAVTAARIATHALPLTTAAVDLAADVRSAP